MSQARKSESQSERKSSPRPLLHLEKWPSQTARTIEDMLRRTRIQPQCSRTIGANLVNTMWQTKTKRKMHTSSSHWNYLYHFSREVTFEKRRASSSCREGCKPSTHDCEASPSPHTIGQARLFFDRAVECAGGWDGNIPPDQSTWSLCPRLFTRTATAHGFKNMDA